MRAENHGIDAIEKMAVDMNQVREQLKEFRDTIATLTDARNLEATPSIQHPPGIPPPPPVETTQTREVPTGANQTQRKGGQCKALMHMAVRISQTCASFLI
jgi:hypothetical protein